MAKKMSKGKKKKSGGFDTNWYHAERARLVRAGKWKGHMPGASGTGRKSKGKK
jgi:hypothetical protein